jgi:hypothetical protein
VKPRKAAKIESGVGQQANLPKQGQQYSKLNCPTLLGEELTTQICTYRTTQLPPGENNNRPAHLALTGSELPQAPVALCLVDRRSQKLLTSQSPGETTSGFLLAMGSP